MKQLQLWNSTNAYNVAEVQISYKVKGLMEAPKIMNSTDGYSILLSKWDEGSISHCEEMKVLLLNNQNRVLGIYNHSKGGITSTTVDVKLIVQAALLSNATSLIIAHNHPSGGLEPSQADKSLTKEVVNACKLFNIHVLDHIIITAESFYSFGDNALI